VLLIQARVSQTSKFAYQRLDRAERFCGLLIELQAKPYGKAPETSGDDTKRDRN